MSLDGRFGVPSVGRFLTKARVLGTRLIYERTIFVLAVMFCAAVGGTLWHLSRLSSTLVESGALVGTSLYSDSLLELRKFYNSEVVQRVRPHGIEVTHDYTKKTAAIPIPATFTIEFGKRIGEKDPGMQIRLYSDYPFPFRKGGGPRDNFQRDALNWLRQNPDRPFYRFEDFQGHPSLRYATAIQMQAGCVSCHNSHPESPKIDWKVGDVRGIQEITRPLGGVIAETRLGLQKTFFLLATMGLIGLGGLALAIGKMRRSSAELEQRVAERTAAEARLSGLHEINLAATSTLDLNMVLKVLLEKIDFFLPYSAATVRLFNKESGMLEPLACRNLNEEEWKSAQWRGGRGIPNVVFENKVPWIVRNVQTDPRIRDPEFFRKHGLISYLGVPLTVKDEVLGVLSFYTKDAHEFSDDEVEFLCTLADQAAIAINNCQLYDQARAREVQLQETNRMLSALHRVAVAASESLDLDRVFQAAIEQVTAMFRFSTTRIHTYEESTDELVLRASLSSDPDRVTAAKSFPKGQGIVGTVAVSGKPLMFEDVQTDPLYHALSRTKISGQFGYHFFAVFPIRGKSKTLGTLGCVGTAPRKLSAGEVQFLEAIADRIAVAMENSELYEQLRQKVKELQQKTAELEKANNVKSEFLSVMSHELRTPLNVFMGYTVMLKERMLGEINTEQDKVIGKMLGSSKDLLVMINGILEATKIEAGAAMVRKEEVSLSHFLDDIRTGYEIPLGKQLSVSWNYSHTLPIMLTDSDKLRHILQNLINNAIKFTEEGAVTISARIKENGTGKPRAARWVEFKIEDTGVGIPEKSMTTIFEKFRQVDSSETRAYGGVGLGLYIVKKFTELLGGEVQVQSEPSVGSTFTVKIPIQEGIALAG